jgi:hypothetical protein
VINSDSSHHDHDKPSAVNQNKGGGKRPRKEGSQRWIRNQLRAKVHDLFKQASLQNSVALAASEKATAAKEQAEAATAAAAVAVNVMGEAILKCEKAVSTTVIAAEGITHKLEELNEIIQLLRSEESQRRLVNSLGLGVLWVATCVLFCTRMMLVITFPSLDRHSVYVSVPESNT